MRSHSFAHYRKSYAPVGSSSASPAFLADLRSRSTRASSRPVPAQEALIAPIKSPDLSSQPPAVSGRIILGLETTTLPSSAFLSASVVAPVRTQGVSEPSAEIPSAVPRTTISTSQCSKTRPSVTAAMANWPSSSFDQSFSTSLIPSTWAFQPTLLPDQVLERSAARPGPRVRFNSRSKFFISACSEARARSITDQLPFRAP